MNKMTHLLRQLRHRGIRYCLVDCLTHSRLSKRTRDLLMFELQASRLSDNQSSSPVAETLSARKLHFGAGSRMVVGWHNIDAFSGDQRVDLRRRLPFASGSFDIAVSQHVVEHLDFENELQTLLCELWRVLVGGGTLFVSTPDMFRLCRDYVQQGAESWVRYYQGRHPRFTLGEYPASQMVNFVFHQNGEHKNLFDSSLLIFSLEKAGFVDVKKIDEGQFLNACPAFPKRSDDDTTLYVIAHKP
jgi:predicted SAM-dependent methyltransferase